MADGTVVAAASVPGTGRSTSLPVAGSTTIEPVARRAVACVPIPARRSSSSGRRNQPPRPTTIVSLSAPSRGPLLRHASVANADDAVGDARRLRVVADDHRRARVLAHELGERPVHLVGGCRVELAGRFVGEEDAGAVRERRAQRDALLLATGELSRQPVALRREPDTFEQLVGSPQPVGRRCAAQSKLEGDELACSQLGRQCSRVVLVGVAEQRRPVPRELPRGQLSDLLAVDAHDPGGRPVEAREDPEQRRLARAARDRAR